MTFVRTETPEERFWRRVSGDGGVETCWEWRSPKRDGYGRFVVAGRYYLAHRWAYEAMVTEIPAGLELDHLCVNPRCVNPWHLEPVTPLVNTRRSRAGQATGARHRAKTHCPQGHPYDAVNTYHPPRTPTWRMCRTCLRMRPAPQEEP